MENIWLEFQKYVHGSFGHSLSEDQINLFKIYLAELKEWNKKFNLVSFKTDEELIFRHFADSLSALKSLTKLNKNDPSIVDLGSGAGFPGIPIKIALPQAQLTLVESIVKKCGFLENLVAKLSLNLTEVINERAELIGHNKNFREKFDVAVSRAFAKFSPNLEMALPLVKQGGRLLIYKTENSAFGEEGVESVEKTLNVLGGEFIEHFCYDLPDQPLTYCLLIFEKIKPSPKEFPRKPGIPEKKPL